MILSASRRTDIPCYYSEWFINRLKAEFLYTRNPFNNAQISKIALSPDVVDCIVFWTKDAENIIDKLPILDILGYKYYFQFTLTPYDNTFEKNLRRKTDIESTFIKLSNLIGKDRVLWRYDPIILNDRLDIAYHKAEFSRLSQILHNYTNSVTISFVDMYPKLKTQLICPIAEDEIAELSKFVGEMAKSYGLEVNACSEKLDLSAYGITKSSCIDKEILERICGASLDIKQDKNQREGCGCYESIDIGSYNTCLNGCIYCYANNSYEAALKRNISHNLLNEILVGEVLPHEKTAERKMKSSINCQLRLKL